MKANERKKKTKLWIGKRRSGSLSRKKNLFLPASFCIESLNLRQTSFRCVLTSEAFLCIADKCTVRSDSYSQTYLRDEEVGFGS